MLPLPHSVHFQNDAKGYALVIDSHRYNLVPGLPFGDGELESGGDSSLIWKRNGTASGKIDLRPLLDEWLDDDDLWGGHKEANELRWMETGRGGGIDLVVSQTVPLPEGDALAILNMRSGAYSFLAPINQILVKLHRNPFRVERIRILGGFGGDLPPSPYRLYTLGGKILCNMGSSIAKVDASGRIIRTICPWSLADVPVGICAHRWLISVWGGSQEDGLRATDLIHGKTFDLVDWRKSGVPAKYGRFTPFRYMNRSMIDQEEPYVLFGLTNYSDGKQVFFSIHLPDGKRRDIPGPTTSASVVGPYAITETGNALSLFHLASGRPLGTFPITSR